MVRHDPRNQRGPEPRGGRPPVAKVMPSVPTSLLTLSPVEEYKKLWAAGIVDLTFAIRTIEAYINIGLPGANPKDLEELADWLSTLLKEDALK